MEKWGPSAQMKLRPPGNNCFLSPLQHLLGVLGTGHSSVSKAIRKRTAPVALLPSHCQWEKV